MKIKTELLPTRCEICHLSDKFDAKRNVCSRCKEVSRDINVIKDKQQNLRNQLQISQKWFYCENHSIHVLSLLLFIGIFIFPIILIDLCKMLGISSILFFKLFPLLVCIYLGLFIYSFICGVVNKTIIKATNEKLLVMYKPLPIWLTIEVESKNIAKFLLVKNYFTSNYTLKVLLRTKNKPQTLFTHLKPEKAFLIERHLREWFNISLE
jgi:hypothetical protein